MKMTLAEKLDSQLTILNIEGLSSSHQMWTEEESEIVEEPCFDCDETGEIEPKSWDDLVWDEYLDEYVPASHMECPACEGTGTILKEIPVTYNDSWTTSNIFI